MACVLGMAVRMLIGNACLALRRINVQAETWVDRIVFARFWENLIVGFCC